jgi:dihydropteroate synthase
MHWHTTRYRIDLSRPQVMGIVNITPDSFFDGGVHVDASQAMAHCELLLAQGADILDIGGESSRPDAAPLSAQDELERVVPVLRAALSLGVPVSIDTCKPEVMRVALDLGVDIINDIHALRRPGALQVAAAHPACGVCLMHMQGEPSTMQQQPAYPSDVVELVGQFLSARAGAAEAAGIHRERIVLDPGIGFGKTPAHNWSLLQRQTQLAALGYPLLLGWSRKSTLGLLTARGPQERLPASLAAALAAVQRGAHIVRVHDVGATVDALKVWRAAGLCA